MKRLQRRHKTPQLDQMASRLKAFALAGPIRSVVENDELQRGNNKVTEICGTDRQMGSRTT